MTRLRAVGEPPTRADVVAALSASRWEFFAGVVRGVLPRPDDVLVLVRHPRCVDGVGVAFGWPDGDLLGASTGEPQESLAEWVLEIAMDLDEMFATRPGEQLHGEPDPSSDHRVIGLPRPWV